MDQCVQLRSDIILFSGLNEEALCEASTELSVDLEVWFATCNGPELDDPFGCFCDMLCTLPLSWSGDDESSLKGLSIAQYLFALAYGQTEFVIETVDGLRSTNGAICQFALEDAAFVADHALKALAHAKRLTLAPANSLLHH